MDADTEITGSDDKPRPGDFTICLACGQPYWYGEALQRHPISKSQYRSMPLHERKIFMDAWETRAAILAAIKKQNPPMR
jgi:hypothetical protein